MMKWFGRNTKTSADRNCLGLPALTFYLGFGICASDAYSEDFIKIGDRLIIHKSTFRIETGSTGDAIQWRIGDPYDSFTLSCNADQSIGHLMPTILSYLNSGADEIYLQEIVESEGYTGCRWN